MTTFVLAGGNDRAHPSFGQNLSKLIIEQVKNPRILSCFFASPESEWQERKNSWYDWFKNNISADFNYGMSTKEHFADEISNANIIFLHGGDNELLFKQLSNFDNLAELLKDKLIIGSSAGANVLAVKYWTRSKSQVGRGLSIIPYGVMSHYGSFDGGFNDNQDVHWDEAEQHLRQALSENCSIVRLKEGETFVVEL
jgi:peptidase E